jgi:ribonuclease P protein component
MSLTFQKIERLCSKKAIDALFASGKSFTAFPIKLIYMESEFESQFPARSMFVVPKKKHKRANKRNTLKRRMREVYRLYKPIFYTNLNSKKMDIMFVYLSDEEANYQTIEKAMIKLMGKLTDKSA